MITELLGVAGSGIAGSVLGLYSAHQKYKSDERKLRQLRKCEDATALVDHLNTVSDKPFFSAAIWMLVFTVCLCAVLCVNEPSRVLWTFAPDTAPTKFEFWFIKWESQRDKVYEITTGGVAYGILHAMVFQIGRVLSGVR